MKRWELLQFIRLLALYYFICILFKREDGPFVEFIIKNIYNGNFIYLEQYGVPSWGQMSQKPSGVFLIQSYPNPCSNHQHVPKGKIICYFEVMVAYSSHARMKGRRHWGQVKAATGEKCATLTALSFWYLHFSCVALLLLVSMIHVVCQL